MRPDGRQMLLLLLLMAVVVVLAPMCAPQSLSVVYSASETTIRATSTTLTLTVTGDTFATGGSSFASDIVGAVTVTSTTPSASGWDAVVRPALLANVSLAVYSMSATSVAVVVPRLPSFEIYRDEVLSVSLPPTVLTTSPAPVPAADPITIAAHGACALKWTPSPSASVTESGVPLIREADIVKGVVLLNVTLDGLRMTDPSKSVSGLRSLAAGNTLENGWDATVAPALEAGAAAAAVLTRADVLTLAVPRVSDYSLGTFLSETIDMTLSADATTLSAPIICTGVVTVFNDAFNVTLPVEDDALELPLLGRVPDTVYGVPGWAALVIAVFVFCCVCTLCCRCISGLLSRIKSDSPATVHPGQPSTKRHPYEPANAYAHRAMLKQQGPGSPDSIATSTSLSDAGLAAHASPAFQPDPSTASLAPPSLSNLTRQASHPVDLTHAGADATSGSHGLQASRTTASLAPGSRAGAGRGLRSSKTTASLAPPSHPRTNGRAPPRSQTQLFRSETVKYSDGWGA